MERGTLEKVGGGFRATGSWHAQPIPGQRFELGDSAGPVRTSKVVALCRVTGGGFRFRTETGSEYVLTPWPTEPPDLAGRLGGIAPHVRGFEGLGGVPSVVGSPRKGW